MHAVKTSPRLSLPSSLLEVQGLETLLESKPFKTTLVSRRRRGERFSFGLGVAHRDDGVID